jgi:hypothetical protein
MKIVLANQFKNEEKRLEEWLLYNKALGVTDFILVNDHSTDNSLNIIKNIKGITVHVLTSEYPPDNRMYSSIDTQKYANGGWVAGTIAKNFIKIHEFCIKKYGREVFLGFFDVDEFIFFDTNKTTLLDLVKNNIENYPVFGLSSTEVNCDTFNVDGSWLTLQNYVATSPETQAISTRGGTAKVFQNLNYPDLTIFYKNKNDVGGIVHCGGVEMSQVKYYPRELCAFLHFRKPMYSPEINRKLCNTNYTHVKDIALKALSLK